jgi:hypothetical protein
MDAGAGLVAASRQARAGDQAHQGRPAGGVEGREHRSTEQPRALASQQRSGRRIDLDDQLAARCDDHDRLGGRGKQPVGGNLGYRGRGPLEAQWIAHTTGSP